MTDWPALAVDERLFLAATRMLADKEEPFELLTVVDEFSRSDYVKARFEERLRSSVKMEHLEALRGYVAAICLVHHHNANLDQLDESLDRFSDDAVALIRTAGWSFLMAWTLRYGGFEGEQVRRGLVEPAQS